MASKRTAQESTAACKPKKRKQSATVAGDNDCRLITCGLAINDGARVEVKTSVPRGGKISKKCVVKWSGKGEAVFHHDCWTEVLRNSRVRNPKRASIDICSEEKSMIKEAAQTAEYHDAQSVVKAKARRLAMLIKQSEHCVVFSGAGISTSAGIGDYRGKSGKWTEQDRKTECDDDGDDEGVNYEQLRPTYTHEALCKLAELGHIKHVISQNCDDLHGLSGVPYELLSELHGNVYIESCDLCYKVYHRPYYVLDDAAYQYYSDLAEYGESELPAPVHGDMCPQCSLTHYTGRCCSEPGCHGHLRDSIINFGDDLNESVLSKAEDMARKSDLILSLGSTMKVTPACDLVLLGERLAIINRQKTQFDSVCAEIDAKGEELGVCVYGDCDNVMKYIMSEFMEPHDQLKWEEERDERLQVYSDSRKI